MTLTPRERVWMTLHHEAPDRVPILLGTSNTTSMKMPAYRRLKERLGIEAEDRYLYDWPELGTAMPDEETLHRLHSDARGVLDRFPDWVYRQNRDRPPHSPFRDDWQTGSVEIEPGVWYPGIHPMGQITAMEELENWAWPDADDPTRFAHVRAQAKRLREETDYAVIGTPWLLFPFERAHALQGLDRFLMNMAMDPEFARCLLEKIASVCRRLMGHFLQEAGDMLDIIKIGDDLGSQSGLMISPRMYRSILKPIHADFIRFIKKRTRAKVFFHSDGDVFDLIPDFIEIGIDILNPIQTSAGKMSNLTELKKRYGKQLTFCGAVDTQYFLPHGSAEEVKKEVRRVVEIMSPGGGYLLSPVHTILADTPPQNILAMVEAVVQEGGIQA